jgi:hypothetical protein
MARMTLMSREAYDIVIVGAGAVGCVVASYAVHTDASLGNRLVFPDMPGRGPIFWQSRQECGSTDRDQYRPPTIQLGLCAGIN